MRSEWLYYFSPINILLRTFTTQPSKRLRRFRGCRTIPHPRGNPDSERQVLIDNTVFLLCASRFNILGHFWPPRSAALWCLFKSLHWAFYYPLFLGGAQQPLYVFSAVGASAPQSNSASPDGGWGSYAACQFIAGASWWRWFGGCFGTINLSTVRE